MSTVVHFEIPVDDSERASRFYKEVFGWDISETMPDEYWFVKTIKGNEPGIDGALMKRTDLVRKSRSKSYVCTIDVDDIEKARAKVTELGGWLTTKVLPIPGIGRFCYCKDSEGNSFGMLQTAG